MFHLLTTKPPVERPVVAAAIRGEGTAVVVVAVVVVVVILVSAWVSINLIHGKLTIYRY